MAGAALNYRSNALLILSKPPAVLKKIVLLSLMVLFQPRRVLHIFLQAGLPQTPIQTPSIIVLREVVKRVSILPSVVSLLTLKVAASSEASWASSSVSVAGSLFSSSSTASSSSPLPPASPTNSTRARRLSPRPLPVSSSLSWPSSS